MAYGVQIYNAAGNTTIDVNSRRLNIVAVNNVSVTNGSSYSAYSPYISFPGMTTSNTDEFDVAVTTPGIDSGGAGYGAWDRVVVERGTNQFRFQYTSLKSTNETLAIYYFCFRY
jgi:hypothetical protein